MNRFDRRRFVATLVAATSLAVAGLAPGLALSDDDDRKGGNDHERARRMLERGEILPLSEILKRAGPKVTGEIVSVHLEKEDGVWVYEIKYISANGRVIEAYLDAKSGQIIKIEGDE